MKSFMGIFPTCEHADFFSQTVCSCYRSFVCLNPFPGLLRIFFIFAVGWVMAKNPNKVTDFLLTCHFISLLPAIINIQI